MAQYLYTMRKVRKAHGDKVILDDVTLSFLPGAKIGVVGPNGAGKSSVLKIMAGLDNPSNGDAAPVARGHGRPAAAGAAAGRDEDGARERRGRASPICAPRWPASTRSRPAMADPTPTSTRCGAEMGELQEKIEHAEGWELDSRIEQAMDALRCPPGDGR